MKATTITAEAYNRMHENIDQALYDASDELCNDDMLRLAIFNQISEAMQFPGMLSHVYSEDVLDFIREKMFPAFKSFDWTTIPAGDAIRSIVCDAMDEIENALYQD